jgi:hypothetical protein
MLPVAQENPAMNAPQPISPRQRLQELLAIAEGQRTEAQWDEINELEIKLASGNRQEAPQQGARRNPPIAVDHPRPGGGPQGKQPFRKFHKRRPNGGAP